MPRDYNELSKQGLAGHAKQNAARKRIAEAALAISPYHDEQLLRMLLRQHPLYQVPCPACGRTSKRRFSRVHTRKSFSCICGYQISPCAGTIYDHSSTPLSKWFAAQTMLGATNYKISARELARQLNVTYKTAWRMKQTIVKHNQ